MKSTPIRALKFQLRILKNTKKHIQKLDKTPLVDKTIKKIDAKIKQFEKAILILKNN
jgi:hypothetical protein